MAVLLGKGDTFAKLFAPPPVKFADLDDFLATSKVLSGPPFLFDVRTDYVKLTNETVMVPVTLQIRNGDITYNTKEGDSVGTVNILGRVSTITHRIVYTFEDTDDQSSTPTATKKTHTTTSVPTTRRRVAPMRTKRCCFTAQVNRPKIWSRSNITES